MNEKDLLEKAKKKSLAHHFEKAAAHHEGHAESDEKCAMAHKAHAEAHEKSMGKADDAKHDYHKASAAFHKSMANFAEKMAKREKEYAEHNKKMKDALDEKDDHKKVYEIMGVEPEEEPLSDVNKTTTTAPAAAAAAAPATTAAPAATPAAAAAPVANIGENFGEYIQKALDKKLSESVDGAFERLLNSEDFSKRVDQEVAKKMLEKLGATTIETPIKTYSVPRPGEGTTSTTTTGVEKRYEGIREDLLDFVKSE